MLKFEYKELPWTETALTATGKFRAGTKNPFKWKERWNRIKTGFRGAGRRTGLFLGRHPKTTILGIAAGALGTQYYLGRRAGYKIGLRAKRKRSRLTGDELLTERAMRGDIGVHGYRTGWMRGRKKAKLKRIGKSLRKGVAGVSWKQFHDISRSPIGRAEKALYLAQRNEAVSAKLFRRAIKADNPLKRFRLHLRGLTHVSRSESLANIIDRAHSDYMRHRRVGQTGSFGNVQPSGGLRKAWPGTYARRPILERLAAHNFLRTQIAEPYRLGRKLGARRDIAAARQMSAKLHNLKRLARFTVKENRIQNPRTRMQRMYSRLSNRRLLAGA